MAIDPLRDTLVDTLYWQLGTDTRALIEAGIDPPAVLIEHGHRAHVVCLSDGRCGTLVRCRACCPQLRVDLAGCLA